MSSDIHFYGERGLVNALFLDLRSKDILPEFLRQIEFTFRTPSRLEIPDGSETIVIVEAGFGGNKAGFGWPDAVVVAKTPGPEKFVFFFEAKAGLYSHEAQDYTDRQAASTVRSMASSLCDIG